jgi:hypothetical protein
MSDQRNVRLVGDVRSLLIATTIGAALQLAMVIAGHFAPVIRDDGFAVGGVAFSVIAGLIYAARGHGPWWSCALYGGIAGGVCALVGLVVSYVLGDIPLSMLPIALAASTLAGAAGALVGRLL